MTVSKPLLGGMTLELRERYAGFVAVFIQDSTIVRLNKKLVDRFPAAQSSTVAAGVKVAYLLNVLVNRPRTISILPERRADSKSIRLGPKVVDSLFLVDLDLRV